MDPETDPLDAPRSARNEVWMRGIFMLLLMLGFWLAQWLLLATCIVQFLWLLFANEANAFLVRFGRSLSQWLAQTAKFVTCASEDKPFPWASWPSAD